MKRLTILSLILLFIVTLTSCDGQTLPTPIEPALPTQTLTQPTALPSPSPETLAPVSFVNDIQPIFTARCIKCHGVEQTKKGLDMQTYDNILAGSFEGSVVEPGNASDSLLVQLIVLGKMPNRGPKVTADELKLINDWINQGALNN